MKIVVSKNGLSVLFPWEYIGKGEEGKAYRKGKFSYKYYRTWSEFNRLNLSDTHYLENIETERILLPRHTLYNVFLQFKGYTTFYVKDLGLLHYMSLPKELILDDFRLLKKDCLTLANSHVVVNDLTPNSYFVTNHSFNYGIYFYDPGRFIRNYELSVDDIYKENRTQVDFFIYHRVLSRYTTDVIGKQKYDYDKLEKFKKIYENYPGELMDYIARDIKEDNLGEYVKRKVM